MRRTPQLYIALGIDLIVLLAAAIILFVGITGGGVYDVGGTSLRVRSVANPTMILLALVLVRGAMWQWRPRFAWCPHAWPSIEHTIVAWTRDFLSNLERGAGKRPFNLLAAVVAFSVCLRILNAVLHPGFMTGDDVELHEMTLREILARAWPVWNLRSPLYPMLFLYPVQRLAAWLGVVDVGSLVLIGRFAVAGIATISIWLVYRIGGLLGGPRAALLATALFAFSRLHLWYGSSELPRPVAAVFVLSAFLVLQRRSSGAAALAGAALGFGGALRFGELVFVVPAVVQLVHARRWKDVVVATSAAALVASIAVGVADAVYWGRPFHSFLNAYTYTVVEGQSSRGFQPAWFYVTAVTSWTNWVVFALSVYALRTNGRIAALWGWLPLLALSLLPHKEARYLIVAQPFFCISAALAATALFGRWSDDANGTRRAAVLVVAVIAVVVLELGDWHVRRSDRAVEFAHELAAARPRSVAAQQLWRLGGRLYLWSVPTVTELPDDVSAAVTSAAESTFEWVLLRDDGYVPAAGEILQEKGYVLSRLRNLEYAVFRHTNAR